MRELRLLCGGARSSGRKGPEMALDIGIRGAGRGAFAMTLHQVSRQMLANLPDRLWDLLSIASYIHLADRMVPRDGPSMPNLGENWRRTLSFVIAVRDPDFWNLPDVRESLRKTIGFLSGDRYQFEFVELAGAPAWQPFLDIAGSGAAPAFQPAEVILFSGGLDSLAGAVDALLVKRRKAALVSYQSAPMVQAIQSRLVEALRSRAGPDRLVHIGLGLTNAGEMVEPTQRTRSFLFAVLGLLVARLHGLREVCFYENGVVSTNLPLASHVLGTRATRTTHPKVLELYGRLFSRVAEADIRIRNPFFWDTKADVVRRIAEGGCGELIQPSFSCGSTRGAAMTKGRHCGVCTQCLDRRFGILAADCGHLEPASNYAVDLMRGPRKPGIEAVTAEAYVLAAHTWRQSTQEHFLGAHGEAFRLLPHLGLRTDEAAARLHRLHVRHGQNVMRIVTETARTDDVLGERLDLPDHSLLAMIQGPLAQDVQIRDPAENEATPERQAADRKIKELPRPITLWLDMHRREARIGNVAVLQRKHFELVRKLLPKFQDGIRAQRGSPGFSFMGTKQLADAMGVTEATTRQLVRALRLKIAEQFHQQLGIAPAPDDVIESVSWAGYRLNPALALVGSHESDQCRSSDLTTPSRASRLSHPAP
ncbi:hypothetical protein EJV46_07840 [Roseococcus sp. SYP-B2431]|uniref:7-cyano-7-deazaguanine synthase n=1 Tax=Roseococcus sp. SYP-B2431 TaxID=2496640 RepID=UPI001039435A|nr:7-cyano-7-deazaguanine synthase [Roseococcus sp. SYP-B2431]TCH99223.1 hypothetical protein EJV46_07840 [Roseococcus sp. SYP-B2431]